MKVALIGRGGAGRGQGRKPLQGDEAMVGITVKVSTAQREKLKQLGGAPWVREKIDKAKLPKE